MKLSIINGVPVLDRGRPRVIRVRVPATVLDRYKEIAGGLNAGTLTQAQADDLHRTYVMPFVKLPPDHNPETDIVQLEVKQAIRSRLVLP